MRQQEADADAVHNDDDDTDIDREGGRGGASNNDTPMAVEQSCVDERTSVGNKEIRDNNDGCNSVDEEEGGVLLTTMMATIQQLQNGQQK